MDHFHHPGEIHGVRVLIPVFFFTPLAMAVVVKGVRPLGHFSEQATMLFLGASLIGMVDFWRRKISR